MLQSQLCTLVCLSKIKFQAYEGSLLGEGVQVNRSDLQSGSRNYPKHKMQPKCIS